MTGSRAAVGTGRILSILALVAGAGLLGYSALQGDLSVHLILVIPVISGSGPAAALGMLLTIGGLFGVLWTGLPLQGPGPGSGGPPGAGPHGPTPTTAEAPGHEPTRGSGTRSGGIILLGPIPIAWGSGKDGLRWAVLLGVLLTVLAVGVWLWTAGRLG